MSEMFLQIRNFLDRLYTPILTWNLNHQNKCIESGKSPEPTIDHIALKFDLIRGLNLLGQK